MARPKRTEERKRLGRLLRQLRNERDLGADVVADRLSMSESGYRQIESGYSEPRLSAIPILADALGVSVADLLILFGWSVDSEEFSRPELERRLVARLGPRLGKAMAALDYEMDRLTAARVETIATVVRVLIDEDMPARSRGRSGIAATYA